MASSSLVVFTVRRREPELISPDKPTPHEFKYLSDIDDQEGLRRHVPCIHFYRNNVTRAGTDPVDVIRKAIAHALVYYYPLAGRLREGPTGRKLMVECTGDGVMFIEADADIRLEDFGDDAIHPPFPCVEELIFNVPGSDGVLNCPLLLVQVTRLTCGGFIFGYRLNHTMCDGQGIGQFLTAVAEIAKGAPSPSILPVWQRELLNAPNSQRVPQSTLVLPPPPPPPHPNQRVHRSFFFGPREVLALRKHVPPHLSTCSTVDILNACLWKCRAIALDPNPEEEVRMILVYNMRGKFRLPLPVGYYGNAFGFAVAMSTAKKLRENPLGYALELLKKAKKEMTMNGDSYDDNDQSKENVRMINMMMKTWEDQKMRMMIMPHSDLVRTCYIVSDLTRSGFANVDFGWGKALYTGPARIDAGRILGVGNYYISFKNSNGEDVILVPVCLPTGSAMEKFVMQIESMIKDPTTTFAPQSKIINSAL